MRPILVCVVSAITLALALQLPGERGKAFGQEKKQPAKVSVEEIEKLIKQLGDGNFAVRTKASRQLTQTPGALATLRRYLKDDVLERRQRVQILVDELTKKNLKSILRAIGNRKHEAPLDLLSDLIVEHRELLDEEDWKGVFRIIAATQKYLLADSKPKPRIPDPNEKFNAYPLLQGEKLAAKDQMDRRKIVGHRMTANGIMNCAVFASSSVEGLTFSKCIVLTNGGMTLPDSVLLGSFVFSDEDVTCRSALGSLVIARGQIKANNTEDSLVIEGTDGFSKPHFFSMNFLGLTLLLKNETIHVGAVAANSPAAKSGFRIRDVILLDAAKVQSLERLEKTLRRSLAKELEFEFKVRRPAGDETLFLSLLDW